MKRFLYSLGLSKKTFSSNVTPIISILVLSILTITPKYHVGILLITLWCVFFIFELRNIINSNRKLRNIFILGVAFVFICAIYKILGVSSAKMWYCINAPLLYFAPVSALMIIDRCNNEQQIRFLFHFIALAVAINIADNIRLSYEFGMENIVFQRLSGEMAEEGVTGLNFGGSTFVNMSVFYACTMFMVFLKSSTKLGKLLFLIYVGISAYFIIICSLKASAIILMLIGFVFMYVSVKSNGHIGTIMFFITVVGGATFLFIDNIINILINVIDSGRITERFIIFTSEGEVSDSSSFMSRSSLWMVSIKTWLSGIGSFFFGIGEHNWHDFRSTADSGVGNHSDLLDVLARYGIFGALVLFSSIKLYYDYLNRKYGASSKFFIISFFVLILLMGFTKKIVSAEPAIMIYILFPLTLRYCFNKETICKF